MNYEAFKEALVLQIQKEFEEEIQVKILEIPKNNGFMKEGLTIVKDNQDISLTIYLESYFQMYREGAALHNLVKKILVEYEEVRIPNLAPDFFTDFSKAAPHICYKLINAERNKDLLEDIPHLDIMDLSIVFYYKVEAEITEGATILIYEKHREEWGISLGELYRLAKDNTSSILSPVFQTIHQLIEEIAGEDQLDAEDSQPLDMYVLTNHEKYLGAVCFLYPKILNKIADTLQSDFYILPSSIHEAIIMPDSGCYTPKQLTALVSEMNEQYLDIEEVLSDHVYHYNRNEEQLRMK